MSDLKPCPFCGAAPIYDEYQIDRDGDCCRVARISCRECRSACITESGPWGYPREGDVPTFMAAKRIAIYKWNTRAKALESSDE